MSFKCSVCNLTVSQSRWLIVPSCSYESRKQLAEIMQYMEIFTNSGLLLTTQTSAYPNGSSLLLVRVFLLSQKPLLNSNSIWKQFQDQEPLCGMCHCKFLLPFSYLILNVFSYQTEYKCPDRKLLHNKSPWHILIRLHENVLTSYFGNKSNDIHGNEMHPPPLTMLESSNDEFLSNRPLFLWVYRHNKPRGMLGEHEKSL